MNGQSLLEMEPVNGLEPASSWRSNAHGHSGRQRQRTSAPGGGKNVPGTPKRPSRLWLKAAQPAIGSELMPMREFRKELTGRWAGCTSTRPSRAAISAKASPAARRKRRDHLNGSAGAEVAVLDETDSGLDIGARVVSEGVNGVLGPNLGVLLITHYQRLLNYIKPHFVRIFYNGRIVMSGGPELAMSSRRRATSGLRAVR